MNLDNKRVLVTGGPGFGFIASHLVPRLVECGARVVVAAPDLGWRPWIPRLIEQDIVYIKADVLSLEGAKQVQMHLNDVDSVVHLARVWAQGKTVLELAIDETSSNLLGTLRFFENISQHDVNIIFPSSVEVYGLPDRLPISEHHSLRPLSPYAVAKVAVEEFLLAHASKSNDSVTILRYATAYGPAELEPRAIPNFIRAILNGKSPIINGDGLDVRDYVFINDIVDATLLALVAKRRGGNVYNIGTGIGHTTLDLALLIANLIGTRLEPSHQPSSRISSKIICDISKAATELEYVPGYTLEKGLSEEIAWFRNHEGLWKM